MNLTILDLDFTDNSSVDHDNTSSKIRINNSWRCGLGLCDCLGTHSLTEQACITSIIGDVITYYESYRNKLISKPVLTLTPSKNIISTKFQVNLVI